MSAIALDVANTRFILPPDAKVLPVSELSARARSRIGAQAEGQAVVTRQGFRVATRLIPPALAELLGEFREPSRLTDAVLRFSQAQGEDPQALLDVAFDALATLVEARFLVPEDAPEAAVPEPSLVAGQEFAGFEIEASVRSLDDSEVFRARAADGQTVALKIARDDRLDIHAVLVHEAQMLRRLDGRDSPALHAHGVHAGRAFLAMEWCSGVSIGVAAQTLRAARDRPRLHALVTHLLQAYGRLHGCGVLHGDIHPGNCLVRDDGRIVILDFGHARAIADVSSDTDITRTGIPQFHDPQMARALLDGALTPAATPASEQFAIATLAYLLLTGLHPIDSSAVRDDLLGRIAERPPLPFAARGVPAWPAVEQVLRRALANEPDRRFADVGEMAHAFARSDATDQRWRPSSPPPGAPEQAFAAAVESVRSLEPIERFRRDQAWFALRAALAMDDAELLAAADLLAARATRGWDTCVVSAALAQARSDVRAEGRAITAFLAGADDIGDGLQLALLAASRILQGASAHCTEVAGLIAWSTEAVEHLLPAEPHSASGRSLADPSYVLATLALARTDRVPMPPALAPSLEALARDRRGGVQLWALAHDVFADERYRALALSARLPKSPLMRGFALLRRYQLTGERRFLVPARRAADASAENGLPDAATALLVAELHAPETAAAPPFQGFFGVPLRWAPSLRR
ncbi:AarF/UbiB family protein [Lysobacter tyrosinilyticus]